MFASKRAWLWCVLVASATHSRFVSATYSNRTTSNYTIDSELGPKLSRQASIVHSTAAVPRWSEYDAPDPGSVVNVATPQDVQLTVQYCISKNVTFLAQAGGNAWTTTFNIGHNSVLINLRGIRDIAFNEDKTEVTVQGGAIISEVVAAAYGNDTRVVTGNCNCVGTLGGNLGGGYNRLMGLYGFGLDNIISLEVVNAKGRSQTITAADTDLWWAFRGAGPNFGIVTSARLKAYPVPAAQNGAWLGALVFTPDKLEVLVKAINDLEITPEMAIFMFFATSGPPDFTPSLIAFPYYIGTELAGRSAFGPIFQVGPVADQTAWTPYNKVNDGSDAFCAQGGRKPAYGAGLAKLDPTAWRAIWNEYLTFLQNPGTTNTTVLVERYSIDKASSFGDASSSYPWRSHIKYNVAVIPWYANASLDAKAKAYGTSVRNLLWSSSGLATNESYINYANGDESLETVYGPNLARLRKIKRKYDPHGRFNQFFPLNR